MPRQLRKTQVFPEMPNFLKCLQHSQADHLKLKNWYPYPRVTNISKAEGQVY